MEKPVGGSTFLVPAGATSHRDTCVSHGGFTQGPLVVQDLGADNLEDEIQSPKVPRPPPLPSQAHWLPKQATA